MTEGIDYSKEAYDYFIDEIKREDGIVASRLTSSLALQGILFASFALVVGSGIAPDVIDKDVILWERIALQGLIILAGFSSSIFCALAVRSSSLALNTTRANRKLDLEEGKYSKPLFIPAHRGEERRFLFASIFPASSVLVFSFVWFLAGVMLISLLVEHQESLLKGTKTSKTEDLSVTVSRCPSRLVLDSDVGEQVIVTPATICSKTGVKLQLSPP